MPPKETRSVPRPSPIRNVYLCGYNFVSAVAWFSVFARVVSVLSTKPRHPARDVWRETASLALWTQTLAILEVAHSLLGLVRAPLVTTLMQVASRYALVWGVGYLFPQVPPSSPFNITMLLAWSITEVIRYGYFVFMLASGSVPGFLTWLRYNTFFVLYPLGASSEAVLLYKAIPVAYKQNQPLGLLLGGILATYIPGFYTLYTHMITQRRKVLRAKKTKKVR